jgi:carboxyl-terminal processing protease
MGVIPDISFPSHVIPEEFGESSEESALKWDKINPTDYVKYSDLSSIIPELIKLSEQRRSNDPEFDYIREDIDIYKKSMNKDFVSLKEDVRRKEKEQQEERTFQRENERRKIKGLKLLTKGETPSEEETPSTDPYLNESAQIIADLIKLSIG